MRVYIDPVSTPVASWHAYVNRLMKDSGAKNEAEFLKLHGLSVRQGTFNRWKNGSFSPDKAADVALFARELGRNPLEAFVAAGMLNEDEAGPGLKPSERRFLQSVMTTNYDGLIEEALAEVTELPKASEEPARRAARKGVKIRNRAIEDQDRAGEESQDG